MIGDGLGALDKGPLVEYVATLGKACGSIADGVEREAGEFGAKVEAAIVAAFARPGIEASPVDFMVLCAASPLRRASQRRRQQSEQLEKHIGKLADLGLAAKLLLPSASKSTGAKKDLSGPSSTSRSTLEADASSASMPESPRTSLTASQRSNRAATSAAAAADSEASCRASLSASLRGRSGSAQAAAEPPRPCAVASQPAAHDAAAAPAQSRAKMGPQAAAPKGRLPSPRTVAPKAPAGWAADAGAGAQPPQPGAVAPPPKAGGVLAMIRRFEGHGPGEAAAAPTLTRQHSGLIPTVVQQEESGERPPTEQLASRPGDSERHGLEAEGRSPEEPPAPRPEQLDQGDHQTEVHERSDKEQPAQQPEQLDSTDRQVKKEPPAAQLASQPDQEEQADRTSEDSARTALVKLAKRAFGLKAPAPERKPTPSGRQAAAKSLKELAQDRPRSAREGAARRPDRREQLALAAATQGNACEEARLRLRSAALPEKIPEDNYEISDGDSPADDEDRARNREKKAVPGWCGDYLKQLEAQADLDPDSIFGCRVPRCVLEEVFLDAHYEKVNKSKPKRTRGSSADWRRDKLTHKEIGAYKCKLGQLKTWADGGSGGAASRR